MVIDSQDGTQAVSLKYLFIAHAGYFRTDFKMCYRYALFLILFNCLRWNGGLAPTSNRALKRR